MPHFLCFTDLSLECSSSSTDESLTGATEENSQRPTTWFAREENKKSSFMLQQPYVLFACSDKSPDSDNVGVGVQSSPDTTADGNGENDHNKSRNCDNNIDQNCDDVAVDASLNDDVKETSLIANASITSCISDNDSNDEPTKLTSGVQSMFLFGGFELITNVKTTEVYVVRPNDTSKSKAGPGGETYLTTCKGIPARDLPPLATNVIYVDETCPKGVENKNGEQDAFYKFIFVSPGGPKPAERVRLKFVRSKASSADESIIIRTLKVKGRLADSIPASKKSQQQHMPQTSLPMGATNFNQGIPNNNKNGSMNNLASMMAMMGGNGAMGMPMAMQVNPQQQQLGQMQMMQSTNQQHFQQQQQQQQSNHQQEKNQAELISSIAGLGLYMKSSEERTMKKFETMLDSMEDRIMKRLDNLSERMDAIENSVNESNDESDLHEQL